MGQHKSRINNISLTVKFIHSLSQLLVMPQSQNLPNMGRIVADPEVFFDHLDMQRSIKPHRYCAILIGDTRKGTHYVPLSHYVLRRFLKVGFVLKEGIIKTQHNCVYSKRWESKAKCDKFYLIMHEHLFVFRKTKPGENLSRIRYSTAF